nr:hypothetical protein [Tanacetum cinerariifolium]
MSTITDVKCVLSQKAFDSFCEKFHIPEEVHPVLPKRGNTMHERPAGKIGLYTRFFDFANFRLPLSTFLVDILRGKSLVLSWGRTPRLDSDVRRAIDVTRLRFRCSSYPCVLRDLRDAPLPLLEEFLCLVGLSRHYTLDEETCPLFLDKDGEDLTGSHFLVGGIRTIINTDSDLQKTYVPQMEHNQLFTEFNVGAARQMSLSVEVRIRAEYNIKEKRRLKSVFEEKNQLLKARDEVIENLKAQLLLKEAEAIRLRTEASKHKTVKKSLRDEVNALNERNTILERSAMLWM